MRPIAILATLLAGAACAPVSTPTAAPAGAAAPAAAAQRWYDSAEYQAALKIRQANSQGRVILVEGAA